jgi:hypothetical protein
MKRWRQSAGIGLLLLAVSALTGHFLGPEPVYQGKTVTEWVKEYGKPLPYQTNAMIVALGNALRATGTNGGSRRIVLPAEADRLPTNALNNVVFATEINAQGTTNTITLTAQSITVIKTASPGLTVANMSRTPWNPRSNAFMASFQFNRLGPDPAETAIKELGAPAVAHLIKALQREDSFIDGLRESIWRKSPLSIRTNYLSKPVPAVRQRRNAAKLLAHLGPEAFPAIPALIAALQDNDLEVRESAAAALGAQRAAAKAAIPALVEAMTNLNSHINEQADAALRKIGVEATDMAWTVNQWRRTRQNATNVAEEILSGNKRDPESMEALGRLLPLWTGKKQHELLYQLERGGSNSVSEVPRLIALLKHADPETRYLSVRVLGAIGPAAKSIIPDLIALEAAGGLQQHPFAASRAIANIQERREVRRY